VAFAPPSNYFDSLGERTITDLDEYKRKQGKPRVKFPEKSQTHLEDFAA